MNERSGEVMDLEFQCRVAEKHVGALYERWKSLSRAWDACSENVVGTEAADAVMDRLQQARVDYVEAANHLASVVGRLHQLRQATSA